MNKWDNDSEFVMLDMMLTHVHTLEGYVKRAFTTVDVSFMSYYLTGLKDAILDEQAKIIGRYRGNTNEPTTK